MMYHPAGAVKSDESAIITFYKSVPTKVRERCPCAEHLSDNDGVFRKRRHFFVKTLKLHGI